MKREYLVTINLELNNNYNHERARMETDIEQHITFEEAESAWVEVTVLEYQELRLWDLQRHTLECLEGIQPNTNIWLSKDDHKENFQPPKKPRKQPSKWIF